MQILFVHFDDGACSSERFALRIHFVSISFFTSQQEGH